MRYILVIAALAALPATPASANSRHLLHSSNTQNHLHQAWPSLATSQASRSDLAIKGGQVMGEDPDPRVRFELERDNPFY
jgi:hypothetical protein